jgi:hypothetical protein
MGAKIVLITSMLVLTSIVLLCVGRIEYLNAAGGHVLPRHDVEGQPRTWEIADLGDVLEHLDNQFLIRRQYAAGVDAYDKGETEPAAVSSGAPYSVSEQRAIDTATNQHAVLSKLHWCIKYLGWAQYFIAPMALLLSVTCGLAMKGWPIKAVAILCAGLCCLGIFLILTRGYWGALG